MPGDGAAGRHGAQSRAVGVEPWASCLLHVLPLFASWLVVLTGRPICLAAQRVPAVVRLVRAIRSSAAVGNDTSA